MGSTAPAPNGAAIDHFNDKTKSLDAPVQVDKKPEQNTQSITDPPNKIASGASGAPPQPSTENPASFEAPVDPVKKNSTPPPPAPPVQDTKPQQQVTAPKEDAASPNPEQSPAAAAPPTDHAIIARLQQLLKEVDLAVTTEKMLRKTLETEFSCNLTEKKPLLKEEIKSYLASQAAEEEDEEEEEEEQEEDAPVKKKKTFHRFGVKLSDPMQAFLGMDTCPRPQVVKKLWEYIKANDLQDPKNRRNIILDDKLKTIFPGNSVNMLTMNKHLSKHCFTSDGYSSGEEEEGGEEKKKKAAAAASKKKKPAAKKGAATAASGSKKRKSSSTSTATGTGEPKLNGFTKKCKLSEDMAAWMGSSSASRPEITKKMWAYVKEKGLQDPANKSVIVADGTLKKLTGEDSFKGFSFAKYIKEHILGYVD